MKGHHDNRKREDSEKRFPQEREKKTVRVSLFNIVVRNFIVSIKEKELESIKVFNNLKHSNKKL